MRTVIAVPVLDEERHIARCLRSLLNQAIEEKPQILVLDGGSTDRTAEIVSALALDDPRITLVQNPKRLQSAAVNLAARIGTPEATVLVRADAHAAYPPNFLRDCVVALRETGASSVVVPMRAAGRGCLQRTIAAAQNSRFGNGGSAHRVQATSGFVEHGHHAAFDRAFFLRIGGYDESFSHNEDAEFDIRAIRAGGSIWMCAEAAMTYFPRDTLRALAKQYFGHGRGRARTLLRHRMRPKARQMAPLFALAAAAVPLLLLPLHWEFGLPALAYGAFCLGWALRGAIIGRDACLLCMAVVAVTMHLCWAAGFVDILARWLLSPTQDPEALGRLLTVAPRETPGSDRPPFQQYRRNRSQQDHQVVPK